MKKDRALTRCGGTATNRLCVIATVMLLAACAWLAGEPVRKGGMAVALPRDVPLASGYACVDAFANIKFRQPLCIARPPGANNRIFVVERNGMIQQVTGLDSTPKCQLFFDLAALLKSRGDQLSVENECGLLGLAFHPDFARNGQIYVTYSLLSREAGQMRLYDRLSRFSVFKSDPDRVDPESEQPMITQLDPATNHNGGDLHFGDDGYLYYSMGDSGNHSEYGGKIDGDFFSAIYRLDVDNKPASLKPNPHKQDSSRFPSAVHEGTYSIPADNPFIGAKSARGIPVRADAIRTEMYASGLRNPWRMSFDAKTRRLFVADVGNGAWEEIDIIVAGGDYGWNIFEGTHGEYRGPVKDADGKEVKFVRPIFDYGRRGEISGSCITGGLVYRGDKLPLLKGAYVFADFTSHRVMAIRESDGQWNPSLLAMDGSFVAMGEDPTNGDILMCDITTGKIRRLVAYDAPPVVLPETLSQIKAFSNLSQRSAVDALFPYEVNVPAWMDYAVARRWFALPVNGKMWSNRDTPWHAPPGTIWMQHLDLEMVRGEVGSRRPVETRFLVKTEAGAYALSYRWRADGSDADLVPVGGAVQDFTVKDNGKSVKQTWRYPSRGECLMCHSEFAGPALGFTTRQMNRTIDFEGRRINQLQRFMDAGFFHDKINDLPQQPAFVPPGNTNQSIEARARTYLAVNCVQCHQPGGIGAGKMDFRPTTATANAGMINEVPLSPGRDKLARVIVPGEPDHSMLLTRLRGVEMPRMPQVGSLEIDPEAINLLRQWIVELGSKMQRK